MTNKEAKDYLLNVSYMIGTTAVEYMAQKDGDKIREAIEALTVPSVEPEIIRCKDCKYSGYEPARPNKHHPCDMSFPSHWRCYYYKKFTPIVTQDGFCNKAERRTD